MPNARSLLALLWMLPVAAQEHELIGIVRGVDRTPAAEAVLTVRWRRHPELPGLCGHTLGDDGVAQATGSTDARGRFRVPVPVAGPFELLCASADGKLASIRRFPVMVGGFVEIDLEPAQWIGGTVRDADGAAIAGFELLVKPFEQTWARHRGCCSPITRYRVKTDGDGRWRCAYPSAYVREPFWEPYLVLAAADASRKLAGAGLLVPDLFHRQLDVRVTAMPVTTGVVCGPDNEPLAGAWVFDPYEPTRGVRTDGEGRFSVHVAEPERLHAVAKGYGVASFPSKKRRAGAAERRVQLDPMPPRTARLRDANGKALADCQVLWCDRWGKRYPPLEHATRTDGDGAVALGGQGLGGSSLGFVSIGGRYVPFVPPDSGKGDVSVVARTLDGTITDTFGVPLAGARVTARSRRPEFETHGDPLWVTYADHGGRFRFASLPTGPLVLVAAAGVAGFAKTEVDAASDRIALQTNEAEAFEIEVLGRDDKPCVDAWVTLTGVPGVDDDLVAASPSGGPTLCAFTGDDGRVEFRGVPGSRWLAIAMRLVDGKIETTDFLAVQRGTVTTIGLREHKR